MGSRPHALFEDVIANGPVSSVICNQFVTGIRETDRHRHELSHWMNAGRTRTVCSKGRAAAFVGVDMMTDGPALHGNLVVAILACHRGGQPGNKFLALRATCSSCRQTNDGIRQRSDGRIRSHGHHNSLQRALNRATSIMPLGLHRPPPMED
jgi:hypothetical protein